MKGPPPPPAFLVSAYVPAFGYSATACLAPTLDLLSSLFIDDNCKVAFALRRFPRLLTNDPKKVLAHNIMVLCHRGLDATTIMEKASVVLILSLEWLDYTVEKGLGIDDASIDGYYDALYLAASMPEETFKNRMGMLRSYRFSDPPPLLALVTSHYHVPSLLLLLIPLLSLS